MENDTEKGWSKPATGSTAANPPIPAELREALEITSIYFLDHLRESVLEGALNGEEKPSCRCKACGNFRTFANKLRTKYSV